MVSQIYGLLPVNNEVLGCYVNKLYVANEVVCQLFFFKIKLQFCKVFLQVRGAHSNFYFLIVEFLDYLEHPKD